jgi:hypothetical protein
MEFERFRLKEEVIVNFFIQKRISAEARSFVISQIFNGGKQKGLDEILSDIKKSNPKIEKIDELIDQMGIIHMLYTTARESKSSVLNQINDNIEKWGKTEIHEWSTEVKKNPNIVKEEFLSEVLAVVAQGLKLYCNYLPRDVQLIVIISMLLAGKGRLAKVNTGEDKANIVAMLTVIRSLHGYIADVVTNSTILAERDAILFENFSSYLDISVVQQGMRY